MLEAIPFSQPARRVERRRILNDTTIRSLKPPATGRVDYFDVSVANSQIALQTLLKELALL